MAANIDENDGLRRKKGVAMNLTYSGVPTNEYDNGREEKPWQRIAYEMTKKGKHLYGPVKSVPSTFIIILLGWYLLLGYLTQLVEDGMPDVIHDADLSRDNTDTFSEESAWRYLHQILGDEPRVAGTPYHLNKTVDVKAMVDSVAAQANQHISTDWQTVTADYHLQTAAPYVNLYVNVSNVIAVLEGESGFYQNGTIGSSILVNCHYDSVPFAMGASDNAVFCAVMMEVLNKFSRRTQKFKHNIIFLFNGAEETGLQGSHAFLSHPWAKGVLSVVNMDAAGMNGKPSVFQVTDIRVLNAYKRAVSKPSAQGMGEFLFSSGIIPSDTDFRIFRDFGNIHGIDIAFTKWGHVYHTRYDHPDLIQTGVIQNAGDMLLALTAELGDMDELLEQVDPSPAVYYDYLNVFMITYTFGGAYGVDMAVIIVSAISVAYYIWMVGPRWSTIQELLYSMLGRVVAMAAGIALVFLPASIMIATTVQLRYLSQPWLVVPLFWVPYLIGAVAASEAYDAWRTKKSGLNRSIRTLQAMTATRLAMTLVLIVMLCVPALQSARYLFTVPLFIMSMMALVSLTVIRTVKLEAGQHLLLEAALSTPTIMFMYTLALRLDAIMLPVMGRTPSNSPDYVVALLNVGLAVLISTTVSGVELLFSRRRIWLPLGAVFAACFVLMFIPFAPFQDDGPSTQRHYWFHSEIVTFDSSNQPIERTTGVVVAKMDAYSADSLSPLLNGYTSTKPQHCDTRVYCDLPLYRTSYAPYLPQSTFIYMDGPAPFSPLASLTASRSCAGDVCTYRFVMNGAAHNTITLWPRPSVHITSWSLDSPVEPSHYLLERPVYTVKHLLATYEDPLPPYEFAVTFVIPASIQSQTALDVSLHSHKIHHPEDFTEAYKRLLNSVPKYFNIATFLSFRHNYVF